MHFFFLFLDIVWELRRQGKSRYKSLTKAQCEAIERDFQLYKREVAIGKRTQSRRCILTESGSKRIQMDIGKCLIQGVPIEKCV